MGWFSKKPTANEPQDDTAYSQWSCLCDDDSCDNCRSKDGAAWIPGTTRSTEPPLHQCKSPDGCRCVPVYVSKKERGALDTANHIHSLGDTATGKQMKEWFESREAQRRAISQAENLPREKANQAWQFEPTDPDKAIALYRESISLQLKQVRPDALWMWSDIGSHYNRVTLLLEREKRYDEAHSELSCYQALNCRTLVNKADAKSLEKRRIRIEGKVRN